MLQGIRDRAQTWIMWVIVILIIIPFALWGVHQYFGPAGDLPVATVEGRDITVREFHQVLQNQRFRLQSSLGAGELDDATEQGLKRETLERMVQEEVLVSTAIANGMAIGDEQLAAVIHGLDVFQVDGRFSREQYERFLRAQGYVPGGFEENFRRSLLTTQVQAGVTGSAFLTGPEVERLLRLQGQTRSFRYLVVPASRFLEEARPSEAAVEPYYREHQQEFVDPERVQVSYLDLSRQNLAASVVVSDEDLRQWYDTHQASYTSAEQRRARHILLPLPGDAKPEQVEATRAEARELLARLRSGESFEAIARTRSQDPGSAQQGGDLGFFGRGAMDPQFEEAVFGLQVGELSEPVLTPFGLHIIRLDAIQPGGVRPFEEVREDVRRELQLERSEALFFEQAERLANLTYEHPDSLEPAAQALGLTIETTEPFARDGGTGIASDPRVLSAAFRDEVIQEGRNSDPVELRGNRIVVLRVKEHFPAVQRTLDEVRAQVAERLKAEDARARAAALAKDVVRALRDGGDPTQPLGQQDVQWVDVPGAGRGSAAGPAEVLAEAFRLPRPQPDRESYGEAVLANGDAAVIALRQVSDGSDSQKESDQLKRLVGELYGRGLYDAVVESLRQRADVKLFPDRI